MPNYQEAVEAARRLSRTLADLTTLTGALEQLADHDQKLRTAEVELAKRQAAVAAAGVQIAAIKTDAAQVLRDAQDEAARILAAARERDDQLRSAATAAKDAADEAAARALSAENDAIARRDALLAEATQIQARIEQLRPEVDRAEKLAAALRVEG